MFKRLKAQKGSVGFGSTNFELLLVCLRPGFCLGFRDPPRVIAGSGFSARLDFPVVLAS